jgi:hypothetical protein
MTSSDQHLSTSDLVVDRPSERADDDLDERLEPRTDEAAQGGEASEALQDGPEGPTPSRSDRDAGTAASERSATSTRLFTDEDSADYLGRWESVQGLFVDDPRAAVEEADGLVAEVIRQLAETFSSERESLESQWSSGGDVSTEDLRLALQRYRAFFQRLLEV